MQVDYQADEVLSFKELKRNTLYRVVKSMSNEFNNKICMKVSTSEGKDLLHVFKVPSQCCDAWVPSNMMGFQELKSGEKVVLIQE